ncbi:hypothetical protein [Opitutus terrae]|uniref:O-antigen polymerase n=1 Tax=Opitutus terrae (strain DSM 11246 / JCM 15787 / PB90-1) TaxID=452637 RepID=B1ZW23_OPITP|nr:hypothetical protein [Opitutus terrae]ACB76037.1 hypothetical protein Oter_2756 [Opitutus terrae PB90-1]
MFAPARPSRPRQLDRYTQINELALAVRAFLRPGMLVTTGIVLLAAGKLYHDGQPGVTSLLLMGLGTLFCLRIWSGSAIGLPLLPLVAVQHLVVYGLPLFTQNETVTMYPPESITQAGVEILVFLGALGAAWKLGMNLARPARPYAYALEMFVTGEPNAKLNRLGLGLVVASTGYSVALSLGLTSILYEVLPAGTYSVITAVINSVGMSGYFLVALTIGARTANRQTTVLFWLLWSANCLISASGFLLSAASNFVAAVVIGLFWGSGRFPWRLAVVMAAIISFLHIGKFEMRAKYWEAEDGEGQTFGLTHIVDRYAEWTRASYTAFAIGPQNAEGTADDSSMTNRVNNLQNLLFVINAVETSHIPTLQGQTYALIPPLLVPRVFWNDKPRTHAGQVLLNVHFGRQTLAATFTTYIAWGLLPEAYGNFGSIWGPLILGLVLGFIFAWIENFTAYKPLLSAEGFLSFALMLSIMVSFEMVASVLVTSLFQSIVTIFIACLPFVRYMRVERPAPTVT